MSSYLLTNPPPPPPNLKDRRAGQTRTLIMGTAVELLEAGSFGELTMRETANHAGISERTVFRYYPTRDAFLDAVAVEVVARLDTPPPPTSVEELLALPGLLYRNFEANQRLTRAALHTELFHRIRDSTAKVRWTAVRELVDRYAPDVPERARRIAAANIRYYLGATTWHYYRFYFGLNLDETIACAETAIRQNLASLR